MYLAQPGKEILSRYLGEHWRRSLGQEETGIFAELEEFIFLYRVQSTEPDGTGLFNDVYGLRRNIDVKDIVLQPGETIDVKWLPYEEWEALGRAERILTPAGPKNEEFFRILRSFIQPK